MMNELTLLYEKYSKLTDKGTIHSYLQNFYSKEFSQYKNKNNVIVEIGVHTGGSIMLWHDYFPESTIYGIDVQVSTAQFNQWLSAHPRAKFMQKNAYLKEVADRFDAIDIFIDDGPHTLDSQIVAIELYLHKVKSGGLFIIEDVQNWEDMNVLKQYVPDTLKDYIHYHDFRLDRGRYDDLMFVVNVP
jgi:cephalosporin hydroxylase